MKTTVEIPKTLMEEARTLAARERTTLRALIEEGLQRVVADRKRGRSFKLRKATFRGKGFHPEVAEGSWPRIRELIYTGRGG